MPFVMVKLRTKPPSGLVLVKLPFYISDISYYILYKSLPHVREYGFRNPGTLSGGIRTPELWNPEYSSCKGSGIPLTIGIQNSSFTGKESGVWNPESKTVSDSFKWGENPSGVKFGYILKSSSGYENRQNALRLDVFVSFFWTLIVIYSVTV